jgi:hypothetical protein
MNFRAAVSPVMNKLKTQVVYFAVATAVALGVITVQSASAQNASQATIPFAFSANHQAFPAGRYRVVRQADNYLTLMSTETGVTAGLMVHTTRSLEVSPRSSLVFLHDQQGYHLLTVQIAQGGISVQSDLATQPKREREFAKIARNASTEIAMK